MDATTRGHLQNNEIAEEILVLLENSGFSSNAV